jgi:GH15 family glucan-1,4-alpha-glucosidase
MEIKAGILEHLYDSQQGYFVKSVRWTEEGKYVRDETMDASSAYGVMEFGVLEPDDPRLVSAMEKTRELLWVSGPIGGIARYQGDNYYRQRKNEGNPWVITTLWQAQYQIRRAKTTDDLAKAKDLLVWACRFAQPSGVLAEQLHPDTGAQLSAAPLTWSHSTFITVVMEYLQKVTSLGICDTCLPSH